MTGVVPVVPRFNFLNYGPLLAGGSLTVYLAGTTTLATTYQDQALTILNTNPIVLDANGECVFWVDSGSTYKLLLKDSLGATVPGWPVDNIPGAADIGAAAAAAASGAQPYVMAAAGSATSAATSASQAGTYASAAATAAKFYDTIALGLAAVADTFTFGVKIGGTDGLLRATLFRRDSASAYTKISELIPVTEINPWEDKTGGSLTYIAAAAVGATAAGTALPVGDIWINALPLVAGELQSLSVYVQTLGNGNGRFVIVRPGTPYTVVYVIQVTGISGTGLYTVNLPVGYRVNAGDYLGWHMVSGEAQGAFNSGGSNWHFTTASVSVGQTFTPSSTAVTMSISAVVGVMYQIVENRLTALEAAMQAAYRTARTSGSTTPTGSVLGSPFVWACTTPMAADGFVTSVAFRMTGSATANVLFIGPNTSGALTVLASYPATLGNGVNTLQLGSTGILTISPTMPDMLWMPAGTYVALQILSGSYPAYLSGTGGQLIYFTGSLGVGQQPTINVSGANGDAAIELDYLIALGNPVTTAAMDTVVNAAATVAGNVVTVSGTLDRAGVGIPFNSSVTLTLEAGSNTRYDAIYYDLEAGTLGSVTGTPRATDAPEFIPTASGSKQAILFYARVTNAAVSVVSAWNVFNSDNQVLENELERERRRGRLCIQKTVGKVRRGASIKVLSFGDSIAAVANVTTQSTSTPDGLHRDTLDYFQANIGSDVTSAIPLYTAVQLGRADDGGGAIHHQVGFIWELVHAMQAAGSSVVYNNFGIGGAQSSGAWSAGATAWLTAAIALAPDLVVLNFGQNEQGTTTTEANMVSIIGAFMNAGIEVLVMGCTRPRSGFNATNWKYTNRALRRAAIYSGAAFVPTVPLYDDPYIGVIGCTTGDTACANAINHPGIHEHKVIGKEIVKLVMGDA